MLSYGCREFVETYRIPTSRAWRMLSRKPALQGEVFILSYSRAAIGVSSTAETSLCVSCNHQWFEVPLPTRSRQDYRYDGA